MFDKTKKMQGCNARRQGKRRMQYKDAKRQVAPDLAKLRSCKDAMQGFNARVQCKAAARRQDKRRMQCKDAKRQVAPDLSSQWAQRICDLWEARGGAIGEPWARIQCKDARQGCKETRQA